MNFFENFLQNFQKLIKEVKFPIFKIYLAISGGIDSVVLTHLLQKQNYPIHLLHVNYHLRGFDSEEDELFIKQLSIDWQIPLTIFSENIQLRDDKTAIQEQAREIRYKWFNGFLVKDKNSVLVTAHHKDDLLETFLFHLGRGTGINGLLGIKPITNNQQILRPLLPFYKSEIETYAQENNLRFREDKSNLVPLYTRNKIRLQLIPLLSEIFPNFKTKINRTIENIQAENIILQNFIAQTWQNLIEEENDKIYISIKKWLKLDPWENFTWLLFKPFNISHGQLTELLKLTTALDSAFLKTSTHVFIKKNNRILIQKTSIELTNKHYIIENLPQEIEFNIGKLILQIADYQQETVPVSQKIIWLDAHLIKLPLFLRPWQQSDYFYPLGMHKKKKVLKFLKDEKINQFDRQNCWILEMNKKIISVINLRPDNRFKITSKTKKILVLEFFPKN